MYLTTKRILALVLTLTVLRCALINSYALREEELDSEPTTPETQDVLPEEEEEEEEDPFATSGRMYYPDPMMLFEELAEYAVWEDPEETEADEPEEEAEDPYFEESTLYYDQTHEVLEYGCSEDGWSYALLDNDTVSICSLLGNFTGTLVVPETIEGYPVVEIDSWAFHEHAGITEVIFPQTLRYIGLCALAGAEHLKKVTLPEGILCIDRQAFWETPLEELYLPASLLWIAPCAIQRCTQLRQITVDADNTAYCDVDGVLYSKDMTTLYCYPPMYGEAHFTVPESVTALAGYAIALNPTLQTVTLPAGLTDLGDQWTFGKDTALREIVIPDGVKEIPYCCFDECTSLTSVVLPEQMDAIGEHAFSECYSLQSIVIPDGVTELPYCCFFYCVSLQTMSLPNRNIKFGKDAIWECPQLGLIVRN